MAVSNNISKNFLYYYDKSDYNNLGQYITNKLQYINIDNDIESTWTQFKQIIHDVINIYFPKIQLSNKNKNKHAINATLKRDKKKKNTGYEQDIEKLKIRSWKIYIKI